ncbi:TPA: hypothetical protein HA278_03320 [Candidatus Woesearchaeota archaeon]|jgi:hypothetical protein|nr:hypothetical protein [Candidatus Woesearchaeota archaeon]|tara:strand:+ start:793 stop:969 length:177 start_codon:yes stop_codon:yes gene_type:complete
MPKKPKNNKKPAFREDTTDLHKSFIKNKSKGVRKREKKIMRDIIDNDIDYDVDNFEKW